MTGVASKLAGLCEPVRCARLNGPPKASYRSRAKATRAMRIIVSEGGPRMHAYLCGRCRYWHLSKEQPRNPLA